MVKTIVVAALTASLCLGGVSLAEDRLEQVKKSMSESQCYEIKFLSIVESDVFNSVDTTKGEAYLSLDGRYSVKIGTDRYVYDREFLYSYSKEQNQVTIEPFDHRNAPIEEVTFIVRLDEYYETHTVKRDREYRLLRIDTTGADLPDSLRLFLEPKKAKIDRIEFFDLNEDLNSIVFRSQKAKSKCSNKKLFLDYPDDASVIRMYPQ
ncbi:MAG: outer membrane lipoprotein carrier protein LolA [bacterium]|nr:outer membrane lipoprotein carrier protein LolA [bacterium]